MKKDSGQANSGPDGATGMTNSEVNAFFLSFPQVKRVGNPSLGLSVKTLNPVSFAYLICRNATVSM